MARRGDGQKLMRLRDRLERVKREFDASTKMYQRARKVHEKVSNRYEYLLEQIRMYEQPRKED